MYTASITSVGSMLGIVTGMTRREVMERMMEFVIEKKLTNFTIHIQLVETPAGR